MQRPKIVFADNDRDFLETRKGVLERVGLEVISASTLSRAREALARPDIDLAILDVRLENDDDDKDISGLLLATEERFLDIPKLILTVNEEEEALKSLEAQGGPLPLYVDFVGKREGPEAMLAAVSKILAARTASRPRDRRDSQAPSTASGEIFVIHGHDPIARLEVTVFILQLKLKPLLLGEMTTDGRTIMELIEQKCAGVGFAVAILTPDDFGGSKKDPNRVNDRARQNVIFEMGYFMGRLGRTRVRALCKEGVEMLSDYDGVLYIPMDAAGAWKLQLAKELKSAGYEIDLNAIVS